MKKYNIFLLPLALLALSACNDDSVDALSGEFGMDRYDFKEVVVEPTQKLKKGVKALNIDFTDNKGETVKGKIGCNERTLH